MHIVLYITESRVRDCWKWKQKPSIFVNSSVFKLLYNQTVTNCLTWGLVSVIDFDLISLPIRALSPFGHWNPWSSASNGTLSSAHHSSDRRRRRVGYAIKEISNFSVWFARKCRNFLKSLDLLYSLCSIWLYLIWVSCLSFELRLTWEWIDLGEVWILFYFKKKIIVGTVSIGVMPCGRFVLYYLIGFDWWVCWFCIELLIIMHFINLRIT